MGYDSSQRMVTARSRLRDRKRAMELGRAPPCEFSHISLLLLFPLPLSPLHIDSPARLEFSQFRHFVCWSSFSSPSAHLSLSPNCKVRRSVIHSGRKEVSGSEGGKDTLCRSYLPLRLDMLRVRWNSSTASLCPSLYFMK